MQQGSLQLLARVDCHQLCSQCTQHVACVDRMLLEESVVVVKFHATDFTTCSRYAPSAGVVYVCTLLSLVLECVVGF